MQFTQIKPLKYPDRISTPSPEPVKKRTRYTSIRQSVPPPPSTRTHHNQKNSRPKNNPRRSNSQKQQGSKTIRTRYMPRDSSLSTIAEESGSFHSGSLPHMETTKSQVNTILIYDNIYKIKHSSNQP